MAYSNVKKTEDIPMSSTATLSNKDGASFKAILCGANGVGKTSIYTRLKDDKFEHSDSSTITSDQCIITVIAKDNVEVKVHLWDTVGMEKFESLTRSYFCGSHLVLIVYSPDNKESLKHAVTYVEKATEHAPGASLVLIRNKIDLNDTGLVSEQEAKKSINYSNFKFRFKTSAKTGEGIKEMSKKLGSYLYKHNKQVEKRSGVVEVNASPKTRRVKCCSHH